MVEKDEMIDHQLNQEALQNALCCVGPKFKSRTSTSGTCRRLEKDLFRLPLLHS